MRTTGDVVLDASAAVGLLLGGQIGDAVDRALGPEPAIHVPELLFVEVLSALRGNERGGELPHGRAEQAYEALRRLPCIRWSHHDELIGRVWELRANVSACDATYVALAERLDATLITADRPLASAVRRHTGVVVADLAV